MDEIIDPKLEKALFIMNTYGLKPPVSDLEELAIRDLIDISEEDGWIVTLKGIEYIKNHKSVT